MKSQDIRHAFLSFFESKGHKKIQSSSLVPVNDPTLLFTNSGMVQFKDAFLGIDGKKHESKTTAQRCLRAGGKHNDLENVGHTSRHHTLFEMLGNFSFGEYFKEHSIELAWEFLTSPQHLNIDKKHLWVTVFDGGHVFGNNQPEVPKDNKSYELWKKLLIESGFTEQEAEQRIIKIKTNDNFWMMGDNGPCGPCSEIFYDHDKSIEKFRGDDPNFSDECVEVWNLVFMEYNRDDNKNLNKLQVPCVDTGMGLERIATVLQNKKNNYENDIFSKLIQEVQKISNSKTEITPSHKIVADHIRAAAYLISDGVLPSNEGRGYVLRKIIRRALIHFGKISNKSNTNHEEMFLAKLIKPLSDIMGEQGDVLRNNHDNIVKTIDKEERGFKNNYLKGREHIIQEIAKISKKETITNIKFPGKTAFKLYDTYGFPIESTIDEAKDAGFLGVDLKTFDLCMTKQKQQARQNQKFNAKQNNLNYDGDKTIFIGYDNLTLESKINAIYVNGKKVKTAKAGDDAMVVFDKTKFFPESSGQVGDTGVAINDDCKLKITDTKEIRDKVIAHQVSIEKGTINESDNIFCQVDSRRRGNIEIHHTSTHLLHAALKEVLGKDVRQKGSLVSPDYLRFDFSHDDNISQKQLDQIENIVNSKIRENIEIKIKMMEYDDALKCGAVALFDEKYDDIVRMVTIDPNFSIELCSGTHTKRTGDIGFFKIKNENSIGSGIKRIEAVGGENALLFVRDNFLNLEKISKIMKCPENQVVEKVAQTNQSHKILQGEIEKIKNDEVVLMTKKAFNNMENINKTNVFFEKFNNVDLDMLRQCAMNIKKQSKQNITVISGNMKDKASFVVMTKNTKYDAKKIIEFIIEKCGGNGGGNQDYAQLSGADSSRADSTISIIKNLLVENGNKKEKNKTDKKSIIRE